MKLWIDDVREPPGEPMEWTWVQTSRNAMLCLLNCHVKEISFDHDLSGDDTTMVVANAIEARAHEGIKPPKWAIHSASPVGRVNLEAALKRADWEFANFQKQKKAS